jgi:hypothetical protein
MGDAISREQRRHAKTSKRTRDAVAKGTVTEDELKLEATVRGLRAKTTKGSLVRR